MKAKKKVCKGSSKASGFGCGKFRYPHKYGICSDCFRDWLFNSDKGQEYFSKSVISGKKKVETEKRRQSKSDKDLIRGWDKELQVNVNKIVRLIDKGLLCLARNIRGQMQAGHVFARGGNGAIKFNLHNIHRQSASSNKWQNDDGLLREGLIFEYGQEYMDFIGALRRTPDLTYSQIQYQEFNLKALKIVKRLRKTDLRYTLKERITLRNEINLEFRIYDQEFCEFRIKKT